MNWTQLLQAEIDDTYRAADGLLALVDEKRLGWKPGTGSNWMTTGQLLEHLTTACGFCVRGFVTGDWTAPGSDPAEAAAASSSLPTAETMPAAKSVRDARTRLAADKTLALEMIAKTGEKRLASEPAPAPWDPTPVVLGRRLLQMVGHLAHHKDQLFYYIKLQGHDVNTMHLYGMGEPAAAE
jgi:hypothetical protein